MSINSISTTFGAKVFNETAMRERLPKNIFLSLSNTINQGEALGEDVAQVVANTMKDWAIEKGATHFTHWFQPMTGITAEKHDAFLVPVGNGRVINEFSGKELIRGEPDASSFPSGGLRSTFEARGYTAWDATSYAFVKDNTLYIPTAFCSYSGEALDQKTPLLRSMEVLNNEAVRVLKLFGKNVARVHSTIGAEQEYFLVDRSLYNQRPDLIFSGRTLFGTMPTKGQEMDDHYFGNITDRVYAFMSDLDKELWDLGVYVKTEHKEVAPGQYELAPVFTTANIASDHNQLTMEMLKRIATRHDMVCLLHEKPFAGVNGSGKHNNWGLSTNAGENLLKPGKNPAKNKQFLIFLCALIRAVDVYSEALRVSIATPGNDHRLGANEAPPAVISIFLGDQLSNILDSIQSGQTMYDPVADMLKSSVSSLPDLFKDTTDRNRTSPLAFTGNKFEFRMVGSSQSISLCNVILNTSVAESLSLIAERLEKASDFDSEVYQIVQDTVVDHGRVIFNGNNYCDDWVQEAERRGLPHFRCAVDAFPTFLLQKNLDLFSKYNVFSPEEMQARYEIMVEGYNKTIHIEAMCMLTMVQRQILPACLSYSKVVLDALSAKHNSHLALDCKIEEENAITLTDLIDNLIVKKNVLDEMASKAKTIDASDVKSKFYYQEVIPAMENLRYVVDSLEQIVGANHWPFPIYNELLFSLGL